MSVTFFIEAIGLGTFTLTCDEDGDAGRDVPSYEAAQEIALVHRATCEDCAVYRGPYIKEDEDITSPTLNMNNRNAGDVLAALGLFREGDELAGSEDGAAFLARVLVALGTEREDAGLSSVEGRNLPDMPRWFGDARVIECGREAGYVGARLDDVHTIAIEAARLGRTVCWS